MTGPLPSAQAASPEVRLLLECARTAIDDDGAKRIARLLQNSINWELLLRLSSRHNTTPLLYHTLSSVSFEDVPAGIASQIKERYRAYSVESLVVTREMIRLLRELDARGIAALPYKGPALAQMAYGDLTLRSFIDLDVLIRPASLGMVDRTLASIGYTMSPECARRRSAYEHAHHHFAYANVTNGTRLELHWGLVTRQHTCSLTFDRLWQESSMQTIAGQQVRCPSLADTMLLVCVHGSMHGWRMLKQVCDAAEMLRRYPELNWAGLLQRSRQLGFNRMLLLGSALAGGLLGAPLPDAMEAAIEDDRQVGSLAGYVCQDLLGLEEVPEPVFESRSFFRYHIRLRERRRDQLNEIMRRTFVPVMEEWAAASIPESFYPLQYVARPLRLAARYLNTMVHRQ